MNIRRMIADTKNNDGSDNRKRFVQLCSDLNLKQKIFGKILR